MCSAFRIRLFEPKSGFKNCKDKVTDRNLSFPYKLRLKLILLESLFSIACCLSMLFNLLTNFAICGTLSQNHITCNISPYTYWDLQIWIHYVTLLCHLHRLHAGPNDEWYRVKSPFITTFGISGDLTIARAICAIYCVAYASLLVWCCRCYFIPSKFSSLADP